MNLDYTKWLYKLQVFPFRPNKVTPRQIMHLKANFFNPWVVSAQKPVCWFGGCMKLSVKLKCLKNESSCILNYILYYLNPNPYSLRLSRSSKGLNKSLQQSDFFKGLTAMDASANNIQDFFSQLWRLVTDKHNQGVYNTVCLAVLLTLPLLVFLTALLVCCHCCCCRHGSRCRSCCCPDTRMRSETKKKKSSAKAEDDLWISVKTGPMTPDRVTLTML